MRTLTIVAVLATLGGCTTEHYVAKDYGGTLYGITFPAFVAERHRHEHRPEKPEHKPGKPEHKPGKPGYGNESGYGGYGFGQGYGNHGQGYGNHGNDHGHGHERGGK
ncbi:hypothetical protein [Pseudaminobacter soli (ex Li et al. 2025)]|uniref:hypothetical protein n=1 Tax=Pseudaminobacter soli (ex Li et al. 2025) TaxID=1295366 RepID=UPI0015E6DAB1|nr:hypothetical protein [Mesorhizobium soli]